MHRRLCSELMREWSPCVGIWSGENEACRALWVSLLIMCVDCASHSCIQYHHHSGDLWVDGMQRVLHQHLCGGIGMQHEADTWQQVPSIAAGCAAAVLGLCMCRMKHAQG